MNVADQRSPNILTRTFIQAGIQAGIPYNADFNNGADVEGVGLFPVTQKGGKVVHAWAIEGDLDPASAVSNEFEMEWPPRSGQRQRFPEIDRVAWFGPDEARRRLKPTQIPFVDRLVETLEAQAVKRDGT